MKTADLDEVINQMQYGKYGEYKLYFDGGLEIRYEDDKIKTYINGNFLYEDPTLLLDLMSYGGIVYNDRVYGFRGGVFVETND